MSLNGANGSNGLAAGGQSPEYIVPLQINGEEITTDNTFDVVSPRTGKLLWKSASCSKKDAIRAVEAAQAAFPNWSRTKPAKRRDLLLKAAELFESRAEELAELMDTETGSPPALSKGFNLPTTIELIRDVAGRIATIQGSVPICAEEGTSAIVYKEPYGVILGIAPWNAPYILGARAALFALAAGNTTILKASELSPRCFYAIGRVFKDAGIPDGCLNVLAHRPQDAAEVTTALIEHPYVKKINFTGSTMVGSIIASQAGKHLKPVLMELGGKASAIVLPDADLQKAALACALGSFLHAGQICMATERIVVHSSVASSFREHFRSAVSQVFGSHTPAPVLVTSIGVSKNRKLVSQAVENGAKITAGDLDAKESSNTRMRPIVVEGVKKDMDIWYQESFGPTVTLVEVESEEEAIEIANDTEYGLTGAVFTRDLATGLRVAKQIETGAVHINSMTVHDEASLPHGGAKKSGFGRFNGNAGLEEFVRTKNVTWKD